MFALVVVFFKNVDSLEGEYDTLDDKNSCAGGASILGTLNQQNDSIK